MIQNLSTDQLRTVCELFDLDPNRTETIVLTPLAAFVTTQRANAEGHSFIDPTTGRIATDYAVIPVTN